MHAPDGRERGVGPHVDVNLLVSHGHPYPQHHLATPEVERRHPPAAAAPCLRPPGPTTVGPDPSICIQVASTAGESSQSAPMLSQAWAHLNRLDGWLLHGVRAVQKAGRLWSCSCWLQRLAPCCTPVTITHSNMVSLTPQQALSTSTRCPLECLSTVGIAHLLAAGPGGSTTSTSVPPAACKAPERQSL